MSAIADWAEMRQKLRTQLGVNLMSSKVSKSQTDLRFQPLSSQEKLDKMYTSRDSKAFALLAVVRNRLKCLLRRADKVSVVK